MQRGIFDKVGLEAWRGALKFIESDLPRAFTTLDDLHILGDLADTSTEAAGAISSYIDYLENDLAPRAKASFRLGRERFEQKLKTEEGITLSADRRPAYLSARAWPGPAGSDDDDTDLYASTWDDGKKQFGGEYAVLITSATEPMSTSVPAETLLSLKNFLSSSSKSVAEMTLTSSIAISVACENDSRLA